MKEVVVESGMSLFDAAILYCGEATFAWDIARVNRLSLTHTFAQSTTILVPQVQSNGVMTYFASNKLKPATGIINENGNVWNDNDVWEDITNWAD